MSFLKNTAWSAAAAVVMAGGRFAVAALLARKLGADIFGSVIFVQWLVDFCFLIASVGLAGVGTRYFAQYSRDAALKGFDAWYRARALQVCPLAAILAASVAYFFSEAATLADLLAVAFWAATNSLWAASVARLQGLQQFRIVALTNTAYVGLVFAGVSLATADSRDEVMLVFAFASMLVGWGGFATRPEFPSASTQSATQFLPAAIRGYAVNVWMTALISALVWSRAELTVVRGTLTASDVALYGCAITLSSFATTGMALMTGALGPRLAMLWGAKDMSSIARVSREVTDWLILASTGAIAFMVCFPGEIIDIAFGRQYRAASHSLVLLALGAFGLTSGCIATIAQYQTNGRFSRNVNVLGALVLFILAAALVNAYGLDGVALGRCTAQVVVAAVAYWYGARRISPDCFSRTNLAWCFGLLILLSALSTALGNDGLWVRFMAFVAAVILCAIVLKIGPGNRSCVTFLRVRLGSIVTSKVAK